MVDKEKLNQMLDALINQRSEDAQITFHGYLSDKLKEKIHGSEEPDLENE